MPQHPENTFSVTRGTLTVEERRIVRDAAKEHGWHQEVEAQVAILQRMVDGLAEYHGLDAPRVVWSEMDQFPWSRYEPGDPDTGATIFVTRFSILSTLHGYRHHMAELDGLSDAYSLQLEDLGRAAGPGCTGDHESFDIGAEDDAQRWSLSLFKRACPRRFRRMLGEGRIAYVAPGMFRLGAYLQEFAGPHGAFRPELN